MSFNISIVGEFFYIKSVFGEINFRKFEKSTFYIEIRFFFIYFLPSFYFWSLDASGKLYIYLVSLCGNRGARSLTSKPSKRESIVSAQLYLRGKSCPTRILSPFLQDAEENCVASRLSTFLSLFSLSLLLHLMVPLFSNTRSLTSKS